MGRAWRLFFEGPLARDALDRNADDDGSAVLNKNRTLARGRDAYAFAERFGQ